MNRFFILLMMMPFISMGQEQVKDTVKMNEIVIDAGKTNQKIQKIPLSVTALKAQQIEVLKVNNLSNLSGYIPNLFITEHGARLNSDIYIRGIGVSKGDPSVGVYVDDIPYFDSGTVNFELADVRKIEVLRGPQGTLYGRNTMGGLIKVYTPEPGPNTCGSLKLDYGNYNQQKAVGSFNTPLTNKLGLLLDAAYAHNDGFFTNKYDNTKPDRYDVYSGRAKLAYRMNDRLKMRLVLGYEESKQPGFPYALYDDATNQVGDINYNQPSAYNRQFLSSGVLLDYKGDKFDIRLAGSLQHLDDVFKMDLDLIPQNFYFIDQLRQNKTYVEELTFKSKPGSKVQWIGGLFSFQRKLFKDADLDLTMQHGSMSILKTYKQRINGGAMFGQVTVPYGKFSLTTGLRYDMEESFMDYNYDLLMGGPIMHMDDFKHKLSFEQLLPKLSLSYYPNEDITIYTTLSKGYKAGGFNATFEREEDEVYNPEYSWNYEAGIKSLWLDDKLKANLSVFYIDWKDQQVVQPVPSGHGAMIKNAGKSKSKGVEFESQYNFNSNFNFGLSLGYTDAKFTLYKKDATTDYSGNKLPNIPKYTLGAMANYKYPINNKYVKYALLSVNYKYLGKYFWDKENVAYQDAYGLLNANLQVALKRFTVGLWGKNLTGAKYNRIYITLEELHNSYVEAARPTQFGVFVKVKF